MFGLRQVILVSVALAGTLVVPASAQSTTYTLVIAYFGETSASLAQMDEEGNLWHVTDFTVGSDSRWVESAPNGRAAAFATLYSNPQVTVAFLDQNHNIEKLAYFDNAGWFSGGPLAFNWRLPVLYAGFTAVKAIKLDFANGNLAQLGSAMETGSRGTYHYAFSSLLPGVLWTGYNYVQGAVTGASGELTTKTTPLDLSPVPPIQDLTASPDGRWVASLGSSDPRLSIMEVRLNHSLSLVQQINLPLPAYNSPWMIRYTPDGKHAILITWGQTIRAASYSVDPATGRFTEEYRLEAPSWDVPQALAITPDSKFALVMSPDILGGYPTVLHVLRIHDDGTLEWLQDKDTLVYGFPSDMEFVPPWRETYPGPQGMVIH